LVVTPNTRRKRERGDILLGAEGAEPGSDGGRGFEVVGKKKDLAKA